MKIYNKILLIFSFIVMIIVMSLFTFKAAALESDGNGLVPITTTVDTTDLIEMNLYDYGKNNINTMHSSNYDYPGFTQSKGVTDAWLNTYYSIFSNQLLYDNPTNHKYQSQQYFSKTDAFPIGDTIVPFDDLFLTSTPLLDKSYTGKINQSNPDAGDNKIFYPVRGAMHSSLVGGYPAVKGTLENLSLKYLFSENAYATKKNKENISGLFQYDSSTGKYYYSSRNNHAEFDENNDKFLVYNQKLTPNYLMYPFGNFMPFNKINSQTTQVSSINQEKIVEMYHDAINKENAHTNQLMKDQYAKLWKSLWNYNAAMVGIVGNNYTAWDGFEQFLNVNDKLNLSTSTINKFKDDLPNLYAIDFDEEANFFFGFDMKTSFMQPKDGKVGTNKENMIFHFEGDDDVWIYVDGVLFLELSGIHAQVGGEIDFANGVVKYYGFDNKTYGVSTNVLPDTSNYDYTVPFNEIPGVNMDLLVKKTNSSGKTYYTFEDYSMHDLNFYYMERGASSGVMALEFNMPLVPKNSINIKKEVTFDDGALGKDIYQFQVMKPNSGSTFSTNQLFVGANYSYDVFDFNGNKIRTDKTDSNGIITLNKGESAVIPDIEETAGKYYVREIISKDKFEQYANVSINGSVISGSTIKIGTTEYVAFSSSTNDMSNGASSFVFTNKINPNNLGKLNIKKTVSGSSTDKSFRINVKIGGSALPIGATYKIGNNTYTVNELGIINIKSGDTAVIDKIFYGTSYEVVEDSSSTNGYTVSYKIDDVSTTSTKASGTISNSNSVFVEVINTEKTGVTLNIPVKKITTNSDGVKYTYTFVLLDVEKNTEVEKNIVVDENGNGSVVFNLSYSYSSHTASQTIHKYKIYERKITTLNDVSVENDKYTLYDESEYDLEVKVLNESGELSATYTIKKGDDTVSEIVFNNKKLSSLTIEKIVEGRTKTGKFNFEIESSSLEDGIYTTDSGTVEFRNGKANIVLSHNESITIYGVPNGAVFKVTETNNDGYVTLYKINASTFNKGNSVTNVTLSNIETSVSQNNPFGISYDTLVTFKNVQGYELPKTGSSGMLILTFVGTLFMSISLIYLTKRK